MKKILTYIVLIGVFTSLSWYVIEKGNLIVRQSQNFSGNQSIPIVDKVKPVVINAQENIFDQLLTNIKYPLSILLLQVIVILFTSRIFGFIFSKLGQQTVIGEIVAGIFLGPSILGWLFPELFALVFSSQFVCFPSVF